MILVKEACWKHLGVQENSLIDGLLSSYKNMIEHNTEPLENLSDLWDPYSLVHEGLYVTKKGLHLANLISIDVNPSGERQLIKPSTMSESTLFVALGDDGGYSQALLKAYSKIGGAKGIYLKEENVTNFDLKMIKTQLPEHIVLDDTLFNVHDMDVDDLTVMQNNLSNLDLQNIESINELIRDEAENGAAMFIASKEIPQTNLWNQELEFKPYFLYYAIAGMQFLEKNGTLIIKIYDTHTEFSKTLIYLLSCNFTSTYIVKPYSINGFISDKFLVWSGMINKNNSTSKEILDDMKQVFSKLKHMHLSKQGTLPFSVTNCEILLTEVRFLILLI